MTTFQSACELLGVAAEAAPRMTATENEDGTYTLRDEYGKLGGPYSQDEAYWHGFIGDLGGDLRRFRAALRGHLRRLDAATKLTQSMPDSQFARCSQVVAAFEEFYRRFLEYSPEYGPPNPQSDPTE